MGKLVAQNCTAGRRAEAGSGLVAPALQGCWLPIGLEGPAGVEGLMSTSAEAGGAGRRLAGPGAKVPTAAALYSPSGAAQVCRSFQGSMGPRRCHAYVSGVEKDAKTE